MSIFLGSKLISFGYPSIDSYVKALLHFDGVNDATTFDDATGKTWTPSGEAKLSSNKVVYGRTSGYFDGTGDYISTPDSADFNLGSGDWTIDLWLNPSIFGAGRTHGICGQYADANNWLAITFYESTIYIEAKSGGTVVCGYSFNAGSHITAGHWRHIAIVRKSTSMYLFINGVVCTLTASTAISSNSLPDVAGPFTIGFDDAYNRYFYGYIDEFRLSKGIARWTSGFIPGSAY